MRRIAGRAGRGFASTKLKVKVKGADVFVINGIHGIMFARLSLIAIVEPKETSSVCMCCGSPTMEFYKNGKLIAMVGIQHGAALRWDEWPSDAQLTKESVKQFTEWLKVRGVKEPSEAIEKAKDQGALIEAALKAQGKQ